MNDYSALIDAIDRLTMAVAETSNSLSWEFLSTVLATVGSVLVVVIFEAIKERCFEPRGEFQRLRRKVSGTLSMYACYYTSQIDIATSSEKEVEIYSSASKSMREVAVELMAFADDLKWEKCRGVPVADIKEAAALLMALSNSFFNPYNSPGMSENRDNYKLSKKIRDLLQAAQSKHSKS